MKIYYIQSRQSRGPSPSLSLPTGETVIFLKKCCPTRQWGEAVKGRMNE